MLGDRQVTGPRRVRAIGCLDHVSSPFDFRYGYPDVCESRRDRGRPDPPLGARRRPLPATQLVPLTQRTPIVAAELAAQICRARTEDPRHVHAAGEREIPADTALRRTEPHDVSGTHPHRPPARRLAVVHGQRHLGAGRRERPAARHLEPGAAEGALEARRVVWIPDEPVREHEGGAIDRARLGNAVAQVAAPAEVLDRRLRAGVKHADHSRVSPV